MGVKVKMVTGDQLPIAKETARTLGLGTDILDASLLGDVKQHQSAQLSEAIEHADGFAQVFPERQFFIIGELQKRKHIVGMTGDGVNRRPSAQEGQRRHCGLRGDRRGSGGGGDRADDFRPVGYHRCSQGEPEDLSTYAQLRHLSDRRNRSACCSS